jgi:DNA-binding transcriptional regulator YdaS (Cro superfamily)
MTTTAKAVQIVGTQEKLASLLGVRQQTISWRIQHGKPISGDEAALIEQKSGGQFPRHLFRPDLWPTPEAAA